MYRRATVHSSCCSVSTAPTRRTSASRSGKIPTTSVLRRISRLSRSWGLFDQICRQWSGAKAVKEPYQMGGAPDGGPPEMSIATFSDPDNNYFQLMSSMKMPT